MPEAMTTAPADIQPLLARVGMRATPPRLAIWQALHDATDEPDAVELLCRAQRIEPRTSLGTVYRFLRELEQHGLASSRPIAHERSRWRVGSSTESTTKNTEAIAAVARLAAAFGYRLVPVVTT
ncbi:MULTISPECIES: Fur family transcriptional regulator [Dyella]|uniref:Fur family transcriptional regulator n=1 Tax=Dyella TaxID=231454 RepID=UPI000CB1D573|nr:MULTISPECIES: transcriptional repressor [Dyella]MDR3447833.1 transcriptional repressor [Dyella sp.]PMQ03482.1 Transcriptional regulator PerR [Dyella sp. AD56]ULU24235.1 transcriptional repressor [Dyella terrae]